MELLGGLAGLTPSQHLRAGHHARHTHPPAGAAQAQPRLDPAALSQSRHRHWPGAGPRLLQRRRECCGLHLPGQDGGPCPRTVSWLPESPAGPRSRGAALSAGREGRGGRTDEGHRPPDSARPRARMERSWAGKASLLPHPGVRCLHCTPHGETEARGRLSRAGRGEHPLTPKGPGALHCSARGWGPGAPHRPVL